MFYFIEQSGGHFDLLGAALSESGLDGLADEFGEDDHGSSTPMPAQVCFPCQEKYKLSFN